MTMRLKVEKIEDGWTNGVAVGFLRTPTRMDGLPIYSPAVKAAAQKYLGRDADVTIAFNHGRPYVKAIGELKS